MVILPSRLELVSLSLSCLGGWGAEATAQAESLPWDPSRASRALAAAFSSLEPAPASR